MKKKLIAAGAASLAVAAMPVMGVFATPPTQDTPTQHTDKININIPQVCTLGTVYQGVADEVDAAQSEQTPAKKVNDISHEAMATQAGGNGWTSRGAISSPSTAPDPLYDSLYYTIPAGTEVANIGTTTFTIRCNDDKGYHLQAAGSNRDTSTTSTPNLVSTLTKANTATGSAANNIAYIDTGTGASFDPASSASYWNFKFNTSDAGIGIEGATYSNETWSGGYAAASIIPATATTVATGENGNLTGGQHITVTYGAGINNAQPAGTYTGTVTYTLVANT